MRGLTRSALLVAALVAPLAAVAQTPEVERLLRHGIELRQQGSNEAALAEFRRAHQLANTPRTLAQVALAEQALGRWVEAETHLREALRRANDPWVTRNRAALDGAMGVIAQHIGQIIVRCDVDGAVLEVNGREVGALPMDEPLRVAAGEAEVVVRAGGRRASQRVEVGAGETTRVTMTLGGARATNQERAPSPPANVPAATQREFAPQAPPAISDTRPTTREIAERERLLQEAPVEPAAAPSDYYRFSFDIGGGLGLAYLSGTPAYAEQFQDAVARQPTCGMYTCYRTIDPGLEPNGYIAPFVRYNFSRRVGLGLGARIQFDTADWTVVAPAPSSVTKPNPFANLLLSLRMYIALTSAGFVRNGFTSSVFVGGGVGQIEPTPGVPASARYPSAHVISGYGNVHAGIRVERGFASHFHIGGEFIAQFMVPTFLFDIDATAFVGFHL